MPSSTRSRAVPPVDTISIPRSASPRANSTSPRLSETLSSARLIRTLPGAVSSTPRGSVWDIDVNQPGVVGVDPHSALRDQPHCRSQQAVLDLMDPLLDLRDIA